MFIEIRPHPLVATIKILVLALEIIVTATPIDDLFSERRQLFLQLLNAQVPYLHAVLRVRVALDGAAELAVLGIKVIDQGGLISYRLFLGLELAFQNMVVALERVIHVPEVVFTLLHIVEVFLEDIGRALVKTQAVSTVMAAGAPRW